MKKILVILLSVLFSFQVANAKIILKAGHTANPDEPYHKGMLELKRLVERLIVEPESKKNKYNEIKNIGSNVLKKTYSEIVCYIK